MFDAKISISCERCDHIFYVNTRSWMAVCPKCDYEMIRKGANDFCKCGHQQMDHTGNLGDFDNGCSKCKCLSFNSVKDQKPEDYDKKYLKGKGCSHLFKKIKSKEGEESRYVCDNCGCKTNFKPNFWPSVDDIHDSKK